ncbi:MULTISPECIES: hypothetical protein [Flavobacteriaceae]|uniref:hypothetical protein n=1 Tax=Flavobacteriaceae TaxID=49546 RepID=UPI000B7C4D42|nr:MULTISPECIES: hypothetical protein [Flavobacteriaceae]EKT4498924.1 hypothetical protein [Flavobacterium psychrophilum]EKT4509609.1 hypothetical protein [Flavobacterium psychrophilum]ELM3651132.1 hypothetical protein [Flavobacterium psychrophilum]ELM3672305.1 hypothetical protein [Flavobacterium psychrophilum]ELM3726642.1 hypothetical protein [Flavobacterium psychrophilum]
MINDAELYELEILLIQKYENFDFSKVLFDTENSLVLIKDEGLKKLVELCFKDRHEKWEQGIVISFDVFKILQSRYFRDNKTFSFVNEK